MEANIKKLETVLTSKKHSKRFTELISVLEKCTTKPKFNKYLKMYYESRINRIKSKNSNQSAMEIQVSSSQTDARMSLLGRSSVVNY